MPVHSLASLRALRDLLPSGGALGPAEWERNHRVVRRVLTLVTAAVAVQAAAAGVAPVNVAGHALPLLALWGIGGVERLGRGVRMTAVSLGLMLAAALFVHTAQGDPAAHFAFFALLPLTILYGAWPPFAVATVFVALHHAGASLLDPGSVFPVGADVVGSAFVHTVAIAVEGFACLLVWRALELRHTAVERLVDERTLDLRRALAAVEVSESEVVRRLSMAVEFRDEDTGSHTERIGRLAALIAQASGRDAEFCEQLRIAAPLHDAGKVAIPDAILLKPGKLTGEEYDVVKTHAEQGYRLLRGSTSHVLDLAATIALTHHERYDGSGYPRGLVGEAIPLEGRIVAIADVYDALTTDRVYRAAMTDGEALDIMIADRGRHFDPELLDVFVDHVLVPYSSELAAGPAPDEVAAIGGPAFHGYLDALLTGDAAAAHAIADAARAAGASAADVHSDVIGPAMNEIGRRWETAQLTVAGEHLASGITQNVLARIADLPRAAVSAVAPSVLVATAPGDFHTIGQQMASDVFHAAGWRTTVLAPDVDVAGIVARVRGDRIRLVAIACTFPPAAHRIPEAVAELRAALPDVPVLLGGPAVPPGLAGPGVAVVGRADAIVEQAEVLLASRGQLDDERRLEAVAATAVVSRALREDLQRIADEAALITGAAGAAITLLETDRQLFAAGCGLSPAVAGAGEVPISHSLCRHTVSAELPIIAPDTTAHPLTAASPAVTEDGIGAYAGFPLEVDGHVVGALCAFDDHPRTWSGPQLLALAGLRDRAQALVRDPERGRSRSSTEVIATA